MKKTPLVCIVEDDAIHLFLIRKHIELSGLAEATMVCRDGKEAYDRLHDMFITGVPLPEVLLLDLNMPVWDGWQFLEEFVKLPIPEPIRIYILSSSDHQEDLKRAALYGLGGQYLLKPIDQLQLKRVLSGG